MDAGGMTSALDRDLLEPKAGPLAHFVVVVTITPVAQALEFSESSERIVSEYDVEEPVFANGYANDVIPDRSGCFAGSHIFEDSERVETIGRSANRDASKAHRGNVSRNEFEIEPPALW